MVSQNARWGAIVAFGPQAAKRLDRGECPRCGRVPKGFHSEISAREYGISGLCQNCQDVIFADVVPPRLRGD